MSRKSKGINAERDLIHKFWANGWAAVRIAGSGSMKYPSSDIIATNKLRRIAIECKTSGNSNKYFKTEEIEQLMEFSKLFCAEPWIGVKFDRHDWVFLNPEDLRSSGSNLMISTDLASLKGVLLEELIK